MRVKTVVIFILGLFETNSFVIVIRMIPKNTLPLLNQVRLTNRSYVYGTAEYQIHPGHYFLEKKFEILF